MGNTLVLFFNAYFIFKVHRVTQKYTPKESDELELVIGDYIYIDGKEIENSSDGWVQGTSWLTGDYYF